MTERVVRAGSSYSVDELLVHGVHQRIRLFLVADVAPLVPYIVPAELLILSLEHEVIAVVLEVVAYLLPHSSEAVDAGVLVVGKVVHPAVIPVDIDDSVHTGVESPVNYLGNSLHVVLVDSVSAVILHAVGPRNRNSQNAEAFIGVALYHRLSDLRTSPCGLISLDRAVSACSDPVAGGFKGVSEVDAYAHILYQLDRRDIPHFSVICCRSGKNGRYGRC